MASVRPFSYRLKMRIEPQWAEIIKRVVGLKNEQEQDDFGDKLREHTTQTDPTVMIRRRYDLTEFFDATTGLTIRYQRLHHDGHIASDFVDEFGDTGFLFGRDSPLMPDDQRDKYSIRISERSIKTECFDYNGGFVSWGGVTLFELPIDEIVEFGVALQLQFPRLNMNYVIKWPDKIEAALQSNGIIYETEDEIGDRPLSDRRLESEEPDFFLRYGRPQLAMRETWHHQPSFRGPCCYCTINLQVFTPETAKQQSRLAFSASDIFGDL